MWCKMADHCQPDRWFRCCGSAEDLDVGKSELQSSCASCHGTDAKGKGPVSDQLKIPPPDLTMLAKSNNGIFPTDAVYKSISGLKTIPAHGPREMPIWGERIQPHYQVASLCRPVLLEDGRAGAKPGSRRANTHPHGCRLSSCRGELSENSERSVVRCSTAPFDALPGLDVNQVSSVTPPETPPWPRRSRPSRRPPAVFRQQGSALSLGPGAL